MSCFDRHENTISLVEREEKPPHTLFPILRPHLAGQPKKTYDRSPQTFFSSPHLSMKESHPTTTNMIADPYVECFLPIPLAEVKYKQNSPPRRKSRQGKRQEKKNHLPLHHANSTLPRKQDAECIFGSSASSMLGSPCFRAELPVEPAPTRGVKRPANQITTTSIQNGSAGFRSHCERLLRCAEPESKRFKAYQEENLPNVRLTFEDLPNIVFDSSSIGV